MKQLAPGAPVWHETPMSANNKQSNRAGGFIIAISTLAGTVLGGVLGQLSIGILCGMGLGAGLALMLWLKDRNP